MFTTGTGARTNHGVKELTDKEGNVTFSTASIRTPTLRRTSAPLADHDRRHRRQRAPGQHASSRRMRWSKANKRFDLFVFPGKRHAYGDVGDYFFWMKVDYFSTICWAISRRRR